MDSNKLFKAERVPVRVPCERCVVCGDKIKPFGDKSNDSDDTMWLMTGNGGVTYYLEDCCVSHFVHGHPDHGNPIGDIDWGRGSIERFNPDFHKESERSPFRREG